MTLKKLLLYFHLKKYRFDMLLSNAFSTEYSNILRSNNSNSNDAYSKAKKYCPFYSVSTKINAKNYNIISRSVFLQLLIIIKISDVK